jgi:hypothetical protein
MNHMAGLNNSEADSSREWRQDEYVKGRLAPEALHDRVARCRRDEAGSKIALGAGL